MDHNVIHSPDRYICCNHQRVFNIIYNFMFMLSVLSESKNFLQYIQKINDRYIICWNKLKQNAVTWLVYTFC